MAQPGRQKGAADGVRQEIVDADSLGEKAAGQGAAAEPDTPPATGGVVPGLRAVTAV